MRIIKRKRKDKVADEPYDGSTEVGMKVGMANKSAAGWRAKPKEDIPGYLGTERGLDKGKDLKEVEV